MAEKYIKLTVTVELTRQQVMILRENSIDRVFQTVLPLMEKSNNPHMRAGYDDLSGLADLATELWYAGSNEALVYPI